MKPMLAKKYKDNMKHVKFPCIVQPKINGVRAIWVAGDLSSRWEKPWAPAVMEHILTPLARVSDDVILDGELYRHGWPLQKINGAIAVNRNEPTVRTTMVEYHIFDCIILSKPEAKQNERLRFLVNYLAATGALESSAIRIVPHKLCTSAEDLEKEFVYYVSSGYEGLMYRQIDAPYGLLSRCSNKENRWHYLLKYKIFTDEWFEVVDQTPGTGKHEGRLGALTCITKTGRRFNVGTGYTDREREHYKIDPPAEIHVEFEMLSVDGVPLKPTFIEAHDVLPD